MLPKFEGAGREQKATPILGTRHRAVLELCLELSETTFQFCTLGQRRTLRARVGPDLVTARTRGEVGIRRRIVHMTYGAFDTNLATQRFAVPQQGGVRILRELLSLSRYVVRIPPKSIASDVAQENHARARSCVTCRGNKRNSFTLAHLKSRLVEPPPELDEGVRVSVRNVERNPPLAQLDPAKVQFARAAREKSLGPS